MGLQELYVSCDDAIKVKQVVSQINSHLEQFESEQQLFEEFQERLLNTQWGGQDGQISE